MKSKSKLGTPAASPVEAPDMGSIRHSMDMCLTALRALPDAGQRNRTLGLVIAQLIEDQSIKSISDVVEAALGQVDRYGLAKRG